MFRFQFRKPQVKATVLHWDETEHEMARVNCAVRPRRVRSTAWQINPCVPYNKKIRRTPVRLRKLYERPIFIQRVVFTVLIGIVPLILISGFVFYKKMADMAREEVMDSHEQVILQYTDGVEEKLAPVPGLTPLSGLRTIRLF